MLLSARPCLIKLLLLLHNIYIILNKLFSGNYEELQAIMRLRLPEGLNMTKSELADILTQNLGKTRKDAYSDIECLLGIIKDTLAGGEQVKIAGFGSFQVKQKNDRRGRNPQTGEAITIQARKVLTFKVSNVLKKAICN